MISKSLRIKDVITCRGAAGYFFEDIDHIRARHITLEDRYHTDTMHDRYPKVRTPATVVGIGLRLSDNSVFWGDAVPVSFGGKAGRAAIWSAETIERWVQDSFRPWILNISPEHWLATETEFLKHLPGTPAFLRYAVSQAMTGAIAWNLGEVPAVMMARELGATAPLSMVPLHGSSGSDFEGAVDRMLARRIGFLPQGQFENLELQIGPGASRLKQWIERFKAKATRFGYCPTLTVDFHGALATVASGNIEAVAGIITDLAASARPHRLHVESPVLGSTLGEHASLLSLLRKHIQKASTDTKIIADEWANEVSDIETLIKADAVDGIHIKMPDTGLLSENARAVLSCQKAGVFVILGGSCTETDTGARISAHLAMATRPDALLVKPGVGFDESYALMTNEMSRVLMSI